MQAVLQTSHSDCLEPLTDPKYLFRKPAEPPTHTRGPPFRVTTQFTLLYLSAGRADSPQQIASWTMCSK